MLKISVFDTVEEYVLYWTTATEFLEPEAIVMREDVMSPDRSRPVKGSLVAVRADCVVGQVEMFLTHGDVYCRVDRHMVPASFAQDIIRSLMARAQAQ
jgi:hypothetical protein